MIAFGRYSRALVGAALCCTPMVPALAAQSVDAPPAAPLASPEFQSAAPVTQDSCFVFRDPGSPALLADAQPAPLLLAASGLPAPGRGAPPRGNPLQSLRQRSGSLQVSAPITTAADHTTAALPSGLITMSGDVDVHMGDREVQADRMTYDRNTNELSVNGNVRFHDPLVQIEGDSGHYGNDGGQFSHARFQFLTHPGRGRAQSLSMTPAHVITMNNLFYTSCPASRTDWDIRARQMRLDTAASRGVARGAIVDFQGIPLIYLPYLSFPLSASRQTGVLFPILGSSSRDGAMLGIPWYWNIAPNQDATITPTEYTSRGPDLDLEYRFLSLDDSGTFDGDYMPYDSQLHTDRSYVRLLDRLDLPLDTRLLTDVESVSDDEYFEDFTQGVQSTATAFLPRDVSLIHRDDIWTTTLSAEGYETIDYNLPVDERPYEQLPRFTASANWGPQSMPWLRTGFDSEVVNFSRSSCPLAFCLTGQEGTATTFPAGVGISGWRLDASPHIGMDFSAPGYFVRPTLTWDFTQYELRDVTAPVTVPGSTLASSVLYGAPPPDALAAQTAPGMDPWPLAAGWPIGAANTWPYGATLPNGVPAWAAGNGVSPAQRYALESAAGIVPLADSSPDRSLPILTLDSGLTFDRLVGTNGTGTLTLEPRMMYVYIPYRNQDDLPLFDTGIPDPDLIELFRANRYVGLDRIGDANEFTLGMTSELFSSATGTRYISASIGQSFYLSPPQVTLPGQTLDPYHSDLIGEIDVAAFHDWNALLDVAANAEVTRIQEVEGELQYRVNGTQVLNFAYDYYEGLFEQLDTSVAWPVLPHWDLYGRMMYSLMGGSAIDEFIGFQYHGACWGVRALWQSSLATRYGARDSGPMLQVELTGLSNVGSQVDTFLEQAIRGYSTTPNGRVLNTPFSP